jgi:glucose-1-phosphate cytidylyltransferase
MEKVVILAGGFGSRLSEETVLRPKPMVEVGGLPILLHIMRIYSHFGLKEFHIALGYKGDFVKDYFINYSNRLTDFTVNLKSGEINYLSNSKIEDWKVTLLDTGSESMTGGRLGRFKNMFDKGDKILCTYGDGVANVNIKKLIDFHNSHGKIATVTAVRPSARFGNLIIDDNSEIKEFVEKPQVGEGWINGGFFVFNSEIFNYIDGDGCILEREPLERLAKEGQLVAYKHDGFWQCMDTIRDRDYLNSLSEQDILPWMNFIK